MVGVMAGWKPEPNGLLDELDAIERARYAKAESAGRLEEYLRGPIRKSTGNSPDAGSTPAGSTK